MEIYPGYFTLHHHATDLQSDRLRWIMVKPSDNNAVLEVRYFYVSK